MTFQRYSNRMLQCLGTYQFIEEALRFCLVRCHATTKFRLDGYLPYEVPHKAIEDAALGRLIDWYKSYTENKDLIRDLRSIKASRDQFAHRGLTLTLEENSEEASLLDLLAGLEQAHARANECFKQLMGEMELTDEAVNRAYEALKADYAANDKSPPNAFEDHPSKRDSHEP